MTATLTKKDELRQLVERAAHYGASTITEATTKRYAQQFAQFRAWAEGMGLPSLPSDVPTVACYLAALADGNVEATWTNNGGQHYAHKRPYKYASICLIYSSIIHGHRAAGHDWPEKHPAIIKVMHGIAVKKGTRKRKMTPITAADLKRILYTFKARRVDDLRVVRDRAMLSLLFYGAFRRSELAVLRVEDLVWKDGGLVIEVRKSKEDQLSEGEQVGIHPQKDPKVCAITLLKDWLEKSETTAGPIFRRMDRNDCIGNRPLTFPSITYMVKEWVERAGFDPTDFGSHSLRAGFATTAARKGSGLPAIMRHGRWKDQRVAMSYIRPATVLDDNATEGLGDEDE